MAVKAMAFSTLNPNAPLFVPAAYVAAEDFSPEWWALVQSSPAFQDYWLRERFGGCAEDAAELTAEDLAELDAVDEFAELQAQLDEADRMEELHREWQQLHDQHSSDHRKPVSASALMRALDLAGGGQPRSPRGGGGRRMPEKPFQKSASIPRNGATSFRIQQPRNM
eukprot:SM000139S00093  [mRNA]  locus=s139:166634:167416:+ [translate_table: standard]